jgi:chromosome partitioning protein
MRTIAIASQKGGAGKTTLAVHLATAATMAGYSALIIDTDPQATASRWSDWRSGADPEVIDCGAPSLLAKKLQQAKELGADFVVIDTPPHAEAMAREACKLADLVLVPCRPQAFDLAAIETTAALVTGTGKPGFVVFMGGPPNAPAVYRDARELIEGNADTAGIGLPVSPAMLAQRAAYGHAVAEGKAAQELDMTSKAGEEVAALWGWTSSQVNMRTGKQKTGRAAA